MVDLVFWANVPSIHMAPLVRALAPIWRAERGGGVSVVCETELPRERDQLGWDAADFGEAHCLISPGVEIRNAHLDARNSPGHVHIFSGTGAYRATAATMRQTLDLPVTTAVFSERPRDHDGWRAALRPLRDRVRANRIGRHIDLFLAVGELGAEHFRRVGFPADRVHPFGYVTQPTKPEPAATTNDAPVMLFAGQLDHRKGVDLLFSALPLLVSTEWRLDLIGVGAAEPDLREQAERLDVSERLHWLGAMPNDQVRAHMAAVDLLVLPSRFDGWGAVVNEALQAGTPAVVSSAVGAKDLIASSGHGAIFQTDDKGGLAQVLSAQIAKGPVSRERRQAIRNWADEKISPDAMARYLMALIESAQNAASAERQRAPWL